MRIRSSLSRKNLTLVGVLLCVALAYAIPAYAASTSGTGFVPLAGIPNLTAGVTASQEGLQNFLRNLYFYLIGVAVVIAVFQIARGGVLIAMGKDSISKQLSGKGLITQSLLGLVLILSPAIVFSVINPAILNLSVNLPPLITPWSTWAPPSPTVTQATITRTTSSNDQAAMAQVQQQETDCIQNKHGTPTLTGASPNIIVTCVANTSVAPGTTSVSATACTGLTNGQVFTDGGTCANPSGQVLTEERMQGYSCTDLTGGGICLHS